MEYDVTVVGAGPAGAASAILLAREGFRVLLLDKARFPRDKICGEAMSPAALPILDRLGVLAGLAGTAFRLHGVRLISPEGRTCEGRYPEVPGLPDHGLALPRLMLDPVLIARACREPTLTFREGCEAKALLMDGDRCIGVETSDERVRSRAVVLAEGRFSKLHPELLRRARTTANKRRAFVATFENVQGLGDLLELSIRSAQVQTIVTPQGERRAALCAVLTGSDSQPLGPKPMEGLIRVLRSHRDLASRLEAAEPIGALKGLTLDPYEADPVPLHGLLAVGDSTGFFDPLTGEGMYRALRSAELLAETLSLALGTGDCTRERLAGYQMAMRREFTWTYRFVRAVVALTYSPLGANMAVRALSCHSELASRMAGYQGALLPPESFFGDVFRLALTPKAWGAAGR